MAIHPVLSSLLVGILFLALMFGASKTKDMIFAEDEVEVQKTELPAEIAAEVPEVAPAEIPTIETVIQEVAAEPVPEVVETLAKGEDKEEVKEDPNSAFPVVADSTDPDAELAKAYTFDNLQDSMLNNAIDVKRTIKSRAAFSRLGSRANGEAWDQQLEQIKEQIKESGQSIEQFMDNSWAPIPEQLATLWSREKPSAVSEVRSKRGVPRMSREAMQEAPFLTRDATQDISLTNQLDAKARMEEILDARRRARDLSIQLPELSSRQRESLTMWALKEERLVKSILNL